MMSARELGRREWHLAMALAGMVVEHCTQPDTKDVIGDWGLFSNTQAIRALVDLGLMVRHPAVAGAYRLLTPDELQAGGILPEKRRAG